MENKLNWFGKVLEWSDKYSIWTFLKAGFSMIFVSYIMIISLNPGIIYEKVKTYIATDHSIKQELRKEATIKINYILDDLLRQSGADRAWIIEYHNGTSGLGGLPFVYGIMTNEKLDNDVCSVSGHYKDFLLSDYVFILESSKRGGWIGNIEEIKPIDSRLYYAFKSNGVDNMAIFYLKSENEDIGVLGLSYCDNEMPENAWDLIRNAGIKISLILNQK